MSKLSTVTSQATAQNIRAEYACQKLEVKVRGTHATALPSPTTFIGHIATIELEVNKQTKNGSVTVLQRTNLLDLMELAQTNGGVILLTGGQVSAFCNQIEATVELSDYGSIPLLDGEFLEINVFNFPVVASNSFEIDIYSVDAIGLSRVHNVYEKHYFNANSPREIDVRQAKVIGVPTTSLSKLELLYNNGRRVQYTKEEVLAIMRDGLPIRSIQTLAAGSTVNPFTRLAVFNVAHAAIAKITTTTGDNVIVLKQQEL